MDGHQNLYNQRPASSYKIHSGRSDTINVPNNMNKNEQRFLRVPSASNFHELQATQIYNSQPNTIQPQTVY